MRPLRKLPRSPLPVGVAILAFASLVSCAKTPTGVISLTTGGETDALTRSPAPTTLAVDVIEASGVVRSLARVSLPAESANLPDQSVDATGILRVTGTDAQGMPRVWGQSVPLQIGALGDATLNIFVQRVGELARMPGSLSDAREAPVMVPLTNRYVLVAAGNVKGTRTTQLYDLLTWAPVLSPPTLPRAPQSVATNGTRALLIDDQGASVFDLSDSSTSELAIPAGGAYAEVAGGATVYAPDGSAYVVGATRASGSPSARVLKIDPGGGLSFASLANARLGASAAWVEGRGLYIGGGSATASGGEILAPDTTGAGALAFAPDASTGAGATALDATHVLIVGGVTVGGGDAGARVIDLSCNAACIPLAWSAAFSPPLTRAEAFVLPMNGAAQNAFVVGEDASGATRALRVRPEDATEVPLKQARKHARAMVLTTGAIAIAGGATVIEAFAP